MPNRLADTLSPYLLQHADNPVDWYPWGEAAFAKAEAEDKPVFLSIGYATCHWCHVMEHESFEDEEVAALLNQHFVAIKVDREERPDVDALYMAVCQALTGHGGWPLTVLLTPDKRPFFAGTYFPKHGRGGRPGMMDLLPHVAQTWETSRERLVDSAEQITAAVREGLAQKRPGEPLGERALAAAYNGLAGRFDAEHGGFGIAPKFPTP
ncbi:MAG: thioredoxin domain-containing protein, partial [Rhodothermales bacterium]|nr:thioredoxin domain-containing protein [Rhodothermales bacterium]